MPRKSAEKLREDVAADPKQRTFFASFALSPQPPGSGVVRPSPVDPRCASTVPGQEVIRQAVEQRDQSTQCDLRVGDIGTMRNELVGMLLERVIDAVVAQCRQAESKWSKKKRLRVTEELVAKRRRYDAHERATIVKKLCKQGSSIKSVVKEVQRTAGFEHFGASTLKRMRRYRPANKRGPRVNHVFESIVLSHLVYTVLKKVDGIEKAVTVANITHSHAIVIRAAQDAKKDARVVGDEKVLKMKLSRTWVKGFLQRVTLRRRRTTTTTKAVPEPEVVRAIMGEIQQTIETGQFSDDQVFNSDETGMFWGAGPMHQYVDPSAKRAQAPPGDEKSRFTTLETADGDGVMSPSMHVIKCSAKKPNDLSKSTVIQSLHKKEGFRQEDGWSFRMWQRTLRLESKKTNPDGTISIICEDVTYNRPYIVHLTNQTLITCQVKASPTITLTSCISLTKRLSLGR